MKTSTKRLLAAGTAVVVLAAVGTIPSNLRRWHSEPALPVKPSVAVSGNPTAATPVQTALRALPVKKHVTSILIAGWFGNPTSLFPNVQAIQQTGSTPGGNFVVATRTWNMQGQVWKLSNVTKSSADIEATCLFAVGSPARPSGFGWGELHLSKNSLGQWTASAEGLTVDKATVRFSSPPQVMSQGRVTITP